MKYVDNWIEIALLKWRIWNCCCFVVVVMFMLRLSKSPLFICLVMPFQRTFQTCLARIHRSKILPMESWQLTNRTVRDISHRSRHIICQSVFCPRKFIAWSGSCVIRSQRDSIPFRRNKLTSSPRQCHVVSQGANKWWKLPVQEILVKFVYSRQKKTQNFS